MGSWKSSFPVSYTAMGKAELDSWLTTVQFPNVTMVITYVTSLPLFTTAQFKIQVEYFHDYGRVIISLLKGRRFRR